MKLWPWQDPSWKLHFGVWKVIFPNSVHDVSSSTPPWKWMCCIKGNIVEITYLFFCHQIASPDHCFPTMQVPVTGNSGQSQREGSFSGHALPLRPRALIAECWSHMFTPGTMIDSEILRDWKRPSRCAPLRGGLERSGGQKQPVSRAPPGRQAYSLRGKGIRGTINPQEPGPLATLIVPARSQLPASHQPRAGVGEVWLKPWEATLCLYSLLHFLQW